MQAQFGVSEVLGRLQQLEEKAKREENMRNELREKLRISEGNQKELLSYLKNFQKQEDLELTQMRSLLQDKYSEDHSNTVKQREKSTALFNEVVRLGEEMEKNNEQV